MLASAYPLYLDPVEKASIFERIRIRISDWALLEWAHAMLRPTNRSQNAVRTQYS